MSTLESKAGRGFLRRALLALLMVLTTAAGTALLATVLGTNTLSAAEAGVLAVFAVSFCWISLSFWAAVIGFFLRLAGRQPVTLERTALHAQPPPRPTIRTAIVMPIYNEDTRRVFAGIAATYRSVAATGALDRFDFFVLSDTTDPDIWVAEEALWHDTCRALGAGGRLFYRHRAANTGRKAGNIAEWVQRFGAAYECMVVLDADSVMSGDTIVRLAALMEANPRAGIVQTLAVAANRETAFARALQFASRLYGPTLAAGHSFWQMESANYFGHNAIIRTRAFADHCGLPKLTGRPPLGGEILSHDFVEAACMTRARWHVWFVPELGGSFEEIPSNLIDYAVRDRRWAQGNLQHARLLGARGLRSIGRLHLAMGVLAFVASPLWLLLLVLSSFVVIDQSLTGHAYFPDGYNLFPIWPEYRPLESLALLSMTAVILFLPKLLSLLLALGRREERRGFGGGGRLLASAAAELVFSMLLAPVMMLFHSAFVATILAGRAVGWGAQPRDDRGVDWGAALARHWRHTLIGLGWGGAVLWAAPDFLWWIAPVVLGMVLSAPLNVLSSRAALGRRLRRWGLFATPEEIAPPAELRFLREELARLQAVKLPGFADLLEDRSLAALHLALAEPAAGEDSRPAIALAERAAAEPAALPPGDRRALLTDAGALQHTLARLRQRALGRAA